VLIADDAIFIDQDRRGPGPDAEALPDLGIVVLDDSVLDAQILYRREHSVVGFFPEKLGGMNPHDLESLCLVLFMPAPQLRDHVSAVDSAIGPELDQDDFAAKIGYGKRLAVDPRSAAKLRGGLARLGSMTRRQPENPP